MVTDETNKPESATMENPKQPPSSGESTNKVAQQGSEESVLEETKVVSSGDATIDDNCILFGRGKACNNNPANSKMRLIIDRYRDDYQAAGRGEKKMVVLKAHKKLVEAGLKFMKQEKGVAGWVEAEPEEAIAKVGHAIRCKRTGKGKNENDGNDKKPAVAKMPAGVRQEASASGGQGLQGTLSGVVQADAPSSLTLDTVLTASNAGFLSNAALGHQQLLGLTLPTASNPLLSLENRTPMDYLAGLQQPPLSASMLLAQPPLQSMALNGLSLNDIHMLMERERRLQQAMIYEQILRNPNPR